ncbi:hypothetical protein JMA_32520 [Jeotgalibacillus malaysiensis]|uniref:Uncharacterized protein n=1 Tax=Jeotgalibacillus malaysiensis TaxID=1508404 RepID=A0A0B5AX27_9BACL|nr:hypothetical protein JMA_32520 [Jeotgalibacillus malaysiensis]
MMKDKAVYQPGDVEDYKMLVLSFKKEGEMYLSNPHCN